MSHSASPNSSLICEVEGCIEPGTLVTPLVGYSGINVTGGGGGGPTYFLGLKFSTPVFFWVEDLTVYFFGSEKSARILLGLNFRQANSSYAVQPKVPARSESMIQIICM